MKITWILFLLTGVCEGLRDVKIIVPPAVTLGSKAMLGCLYQLDSDALYSVKWYKGDREFFRYTPKETPAIKIFPMHGLEEKDITKEMSNSTQVVIKKVNSAMEGTYKCEVSADAPSFHTLLVTGQMTVVQPPVGRPIMTGVKMRYRPGDWLYSNCTSGGSKPATNLTWVLNGKPVGTQYIKNYRGVTAKDLETSASVITVPLKEDHFMGGRLKLKCTASIYSVYWQTTEKSAELDRPKIYSNDVVENELRRPTPPTVEEHEEQSLIKQVIHMGNGSKAFNCHLKGFITITISAIWTSLSI